MLYCYVHRGDLRSPGVMERHDGSLGVREDDDAMMKDKRQKLKFTTTCKDDYTYITQLKLL